MEDHPMTSVAFADSIVTPSGGLRGYVTASCAAIVAAFGPPNSPHMGRYKMDAE
jgi:hypothetical protein